MNSTTDDDPEKVGEPEYGADDEASESDSSLPADDERLGRKAVDETAPFARPASETNAAATPKGTPPKAHNDERLTKAKLIELGRRFAAIQEANRLKAQVRADQEKAKGILTITLKTHKENRSLVMGFSKNLITTLNDMREAGLDAALLAKHLTEALREYYMAEVKPHRPKSKS